MKKLLSYALGLFLVLSVAGCYVSNEEAGTVTGAVAGGLIGSQIGGNSVVGAVGGTLVGGFIGNQIGSSMDQEEAGFLWW